jgi:hypothetical protein
MQLEALCIQLGITQHIPALSELRDELIRANAAALQALAAEKDAEKAAALAAVVAPPAPEPPAVPVSVTPLQMRRALRATGLKNTVDAALAAASDEVREEWEYATEIMRNNTTLDQMAHALGKTDAEIDALFQLAATF